MKSDPKDCLYCQNNETLHNKPIPSKIYSMNEIGNRKARNIKQTRN